MAAGQETTKTEAQEDESPTLPDGDQPQSQDDERTSTRRDWFNRALGIGGGMLLAYGTTVLYDLIKPADVADDYRDATGDTEPLRFIAIPEHFEETQGLTWAFPKAIPASDPPTFPGERDDRLAFERWVSSHGGVDLWFTYIKLIAENRWSNPLSITDVRARVKRKDPLGGTLLWAPPEGATALTYMGFNLDDLDPKARAVKSEYMEPILAGERDPNAYLSKNSFLAEHQISLAPTERETLEVIAGTTTSYCEFTIELSGFVGDKEFTQEVDNQGEPFKVTAPVRFSEADIGFDVDTDAYSVVYESPDIMSWKRTKGLSAPDLQPFFASFLEATRTCESDIQSEALVLSECW